MINDEIEHLSPDKKLGVMHHLAKMAGYEETVPDIDTFIDDPYYLGKSIGSGLYPIWRKAAREVFPTPYYSPYRELILSGGIGQGKSTFSLLVTLYDITRILSLKDPHSYYNLIDSTVISFALMNATKGLAGSVLYDQIIEWIENSAYFKSKLNTSSRRRTLFIKNIDITLGSRARDMLGQATAGAIFSEINDMTVVGNQAADNFDTISTRQDSRFAGKGRDIIGHLILDSSSKGNRSFVESRLEEKKKNGIKDYKLYAFPTWEAKWHLGGYSGKFFKVYAGDENRDPFIFPEDESQIHINLLKPERIIDVPVENRMEFETNIIKSLRDLAGITTFSSFSFISSSELLKAVYNKINPVKKELIELDFFDENQKIIDFIDYNLLIFLIKEPRFIHIDLGIKSDSTGIASSYLEGYKDLEKFDPISGKKIINREPIFSTEWVMEIRAVPGHEVPIYKIKEFLLTLKSVGYPIKLVSTDGYQSTNLRQDLVLRGINTELISVDRTKDPYNLLRNAMMEGRYYGPKNDKLIKETRELEEHNDKYDHPFDGSKDVLDAVCGSVWACSQNIHKVGNMVTSKQAVDNIQIAISASNDRNKLNNILTGNTLYK